MPEHEHYDELITDAFESFTIAALPAVRAAGTGAVRMTVKRRRRVRITTLSILGALLIAVPVVAFAANLPGFQRGPGPADSPTPHVFPSGPAVPPSQPPTNGQLTSGELTREQLAAGPIAVPAWAADSASCPRGTVTPKLPSAAVQQFDIMVANVVHANLDDDSALETAAILVCVVGDPSPEQVVAYDVDASGKVVLLGRIYGQFDDVDFTDAIGARPEGGLKVRVCLGGCGSDPADNTYQEREYAWDGSKFARVR